MPESDAVYDQSCSSNFMDFFSPGRAETSDSEGEGSMLRLSVAAVMALTCFAGTARSQDTMPRFDGKITINKLTGAKCALLPIAEGQKLNAIYRVKVRPKSAQEVLQIEIPDGVVWAISDSPDKDFRGSGTVKGTIIYDTTISKIPRGTRTNLTSRPRQPTETTTRIVLTGTFDNFVVTDCEATIRGVFTNRN